MRQATARRGSKGAATPPVLLRTKTEAARSDPREEAGPASRPRLLIVHPRQHIADVITTILGKLGLECDHADSEAAAVQRVGQPYSLMIAVIDPEEPDALALVAYSRRKQPWLPVLVLLTTPHPQQTSEALRLGAAGVFEYRCPPAVLREAVSDILRATWTEPPASPGVEESAAIGLLKHDVEVYERLLLLRALGALNWNKKETARVLGINRTTLYFKMHKYGI